MDTPRMTHRNKDLIAQNRACLRLRTTIQGCLCINIPLRKNPTVCAKNSFQTSATKQRVLTALLLIVTLHLQTLLDGNTRHATAAWSPALLAAIRS